MFKLDLNERTYGFHLQRHFIFMDVCARTHVLVLIDSININFGTLHTDF